MHIIKDFGIPEYTILKEIYSSRIGQVGINLFIIGFIFDLYIIYIKYSNKLIGFIGIFIMLIGSLLIYYQYLLNK